MRSINSSFYNSQAWKKCRESYKQAHPLCEVCLERGLYTPAEHIHHIVWLNSSNVSDPNVSLNFSNLKSVCHACHNEIHSGGHKRRYTFDEFGNLIIKYDSPLCHNL